MKATEFTVKSYPKSELARQVLLRPGHAPHHRVLRGAVATTKIKAENLEDSNKKFNFASKSKNKEA